MDWIGLTISLIIIGLVSRALIRKHNPQAVLLIAGLVMMTIVMFLQGGFSPSGESTGFPGFDLFKFISETFSNSIGGVGLMIMAIGGFVAYIDKIGASAALVRAAMKPIMRIKINPLIIATLVIPIGQFLFIAIPSAAGLSLLLMASLFPILIRIGVSRLSAASVITLTTAYCLGPASAVVASASNILEISSVQYFTNYQLVLVLPLTIPMMLAYFFISKYFDRKEQTDEDLPVVEEDQNSAPRIYAIIPLLPIILLLVFSDLFPFFSKSIKLDTTTAMFISLFLAMCFEFVRKMNFTAVLEDLNIFWKGMADIFKSVVTLIIAAEIFAKGLISLGFIENLLAVSQNFGLGAVGIGITMTILIFLAAMLMGSGNAAFFAFGPLTPKIATELKVKCVTFILPMQFSASMGRTISPVSGVMLAVAQLSGISVMQIVKRNIIPVSLSLLVMLIFHFI